MGPVYVDRCPFVNLLEAFGKVTEGLHPERQAGRFFRAGGKGVGVLVQRERRVAHLDPGELPGVEAEAVVPHCLDVNIDGTAALRPDPDDPPRPALLQPGFDQPEVGDQRHQPHARDQPQDLLPERIDVQPGEGHVGLGEDEYQNAQTRVNEAPVLVADLQPFPPNGGHRQGDQQQHRQDAELTGVGAPEGIEEHDARRVLDEQEDGVDQHQQHGDDRDLPVVLQYHVDAVGVGQRLKATDQDKLDADLRQSDEAQCHGQLHQERAPRRDRRHQHQPDGCQHDEKVYA